MFRHILSRLSRGVGKFKFYEEPFYAPRGYSSHTDLSAVQVKRATNFAKAINESLGPFVFLDCGADIGLVSRHIAHLCPMLTEIIAFEVRRDVMPILEANLSLIGIPHQALSIGVSNFIGMADLDGQGDGTFIKRDRNGTTKIVTIDSLGIAPSDIALKLDVEGEELEAAEGATRTMRMARRVAMFLEIHPDTLQRKNLTAESLLQRISSIRPFRWVLAEDPDLTICAARPFFDQVSETRQYDLIGLS